MPENNGVVDVADDVAPNEEKAGAPPEGAAPGVCPNAGVEVAADGAGVAPKALLGVVANKFPDVPKILEDGAGAPGAGVEAPNAGVDADVPNRPLLGAGAGTGLPNRLAPGAGDDEAPKENPVPEDGAAPNKPPDGAGAKLPNTPPAAGAGVGTVCLR